MFRCEPVPAPDGRDLLAVAPCGATWLEGALERAAAILARHPDTAAVHGDAHLLDERGRRAGALTGTELTPLPLVRALYRRGAGTVGPAWVIRRSVLEELGGLDELVGGAATLELCLRAGRAGHRLRHAGAAPLVSLRAADADADLEATERVLAAGLERFALRELVPELDWAVLEPASADRQALERLATDLEERREPRLPGLSATLRRRAGAIAVPRPAQLTPRLGSHPPTPRRLLITSFGWGDAGGGTTVPRLVAKELARRGWDVTVFHAAVKLTGTGIPYEVREWVEDGVRLIGVHNRPHGLWDIGNPRREIEDPPITAAFLDVLDRIRPDVVHYYNLTNLGMALMDHVAARGIPAHFTPNNYWLLCPRGYLMDGRGAVCAGPGDGARCASCVGSADVAGHQLRLREFRARAHRCLDSIQAVSASVRRTLLASGYDDRLVDVVRQAMPEETEIWTRAGRDRAPGRTGERLTVAFLGSAYPHKGPHVLVEAAQRTAAELNVKIHGEVPEQFARKLRELDRRGVVELTGAFAPSEISDLLRDADVVSLPSMWWDCAPLAAFECLSARVPLVVPRLGGLAESVRDGVDGLLFDALDAGDLAEKLDRLALEDGLLERMQAAIEAPPAFSGYVDELEAYYRGERPGRVEPVAAAAELAVRWKGDHGLSSSLSIVNDRIVERLLGPVQRVATSGEALDPPLPHEADVEVRHQWPPDLSVPPAGRLAAIVPWEFGAVPTDWLGQIAANVDELWVPSEYVRRMYLEGGADPDRVVVIPNGVDLELFTPHGPAAGPGLDRAGAGTRFLFVGGLIGRKGPDVLLEAWKEAFAGRDDVTLVIKDFGADGVYRGADRGPIRAYAESGALPRLELVHADLPATELAALYRSCDVLVHPYRGEGFAMPVLEAMACGLPAIVTAGGPTDEFCPPEAGWRIRSSRLEFPSDRLDAYVTAGRPWLLEPDRGHLVELLREADSLSPGARQERGRAARAAAERLSWDAVATRYAERLLALARVPPRLGSGAAPAGFPLTEDVSLRLLAAPAWKSRDRLGELLAEWSAATVPATSACLYLLADPAVDGAPEDLESVVLAAAAASGADLEDCGDINVLMEPMRPDRDPRLHATVDAFVPLHRACAGHLRFAAAAGNAVVELGSGELRELVGRASAVGVA
jgi:glycosyltransferase involved in cell wall biosynthesis